MSIDDELPWCDGPVLAEAKMNAAIRTARWLRRMERLDAEVPRWREYDLRYLPAATDVLHEVRLIEFVDWRWRNDSGLWRDMPDWPVLVHMPLYARRLRRLPYVLRCGMNRGRFCDDCGVAAEVWHVDRGGRLVRDALDCPIPRRVRPRVCVTFFPPEHLSSHSVRRAPMEVTYNYPQWHKTPVNA